MLSSSCAQCADEPQQGCDRSPPLPPESPKRQSARSRRRPGSCLWLCGILAFWHRIGIAKDILPRSGSCPIGSRVSSRGTSRVSLHGFRPQISPPDLALANMITNACNGLTGMSRDADWRMPSTSDDHGVQSLRISGRLPPRMLANKWPLSCLYRQK
jgi:hypothetical protein